MATNYPTAIDAFVNPTASSDEVLIPHATQHQNHNDSVTALETKVGVNGSAVTTTHDYKLNEVTGVDKAVGKTATQTLTNKTLTTPILNTGTDAVGDVYVRNTGGTITKVAPTIAGDVLTSTGVGSIPSFQTPTSVVNASTTVKGVVEIATVAEINAGTAVGATGAVLAVSPDNLILANLSNPSKLVNNNFIAGEPITAGQPVYGGVYQTGAAITYDNRADFRDSWSGTSTTITRSYTVTSSANRILIVAIGTDFSTGGPGTIASVNYAGNPMTLLQSSGTCYLYYILNPTAGTNNITFTVTSGGGVNAGVVNTIAYSYFNISGIPTSSLATLTTTVSGNWANYGNSLVLGFTAGSTSGTTVSCAACPNNQTQSQPNRLAYFSGESAIADIAGMGSIISVFTGGNWSSYDVVFTVGLLPLNPATTGYAKLTRTSNAAPFSSLRYLNYLGIASNTATLLSPVTIQTNGTATNLTGLTPNAVYFLNDTAGSIGLTAGANSKRIGIATTATTLLMKDAI